MELNHRFQHVGLASCRLTTGPYSGRSRSRTDKITSFSSWPLFQFAYSAIKWQVQESHLAGEGYEPWPGTGPPAARRFRIFEFVDDAEAASQFVKSEIRDSKSEIEIAGPGIEPWRPAL